MGLMDFVKRSIFNRMLSKLDAEGAKKWPKGWIRVRRAAAGWKTLAGAALYYTPEIMQFAETWIPGIVQALGMDDEAAAGAVKGVGAVLAFIGVAGKFVKFTAPVERRQRTMSARTDAGQLAHVTPLAEAGGSVTDEARVVYANVMKKDIEAGATLQEAGKSAKAAVAKVAGL